MFSRLHPPLWRLVVVGVLAFLLAGTGKARAQIMHIDYTNINQQYSSPANSGSYIDPSIVSSQFGKDPRFSRWQLVGKTTGIEKFLTYNRASLSAGNLSTGTNPMSGQMNNSYGNLSLENNSNSGKMSDASVWKQMYPQTNNIPQKMFPGQFTPSDPRLNPDSQRLSSLNNVTNDTRLDSSISGPSKFTDAFVFHASEQNGAYNKDALDQAGRELSLQDINRYWFQGEHSGTPGLPLTQAGGVTSQPTFNGSGSLTNLPATFDGNALRGGKVPSGTSNEFHVITQDGVQAYQPPLGGLNADSIPKAKDSTTSSSSAINGFGDGYQMIYSKRFTDKASETTTTINPTDGSNLTLQLDAPRMVIWGPKGNKVKVDPPDPTPGTAPTK